jgi:hypothetical protein
MATSSSSLMKTTLHNSIADGIYNEVTSKYTRYYYFLGRTLTWEDELAPPIPVDSYAYELQSRNEMITLKEINPTDISYVIPRYDWVEGSTYDQFDDQYSTEVQGINLTAGGFSYASAPYVYVGSFGAVTWAASTPYVYGQLIKSANGMRCYAVLNTGISGTVEPTYTDNNTHTNGTMTIQYVAHNDGSGTGATAESYVLDGQVIDIILTHRGSGYTSPPTVTILGGGGGGAEAYGVVNIAASGTQKLESAQHYVVTNEFNVYQCLDNNKNSVSTVKPTSTSVEAISTADGYLWKFIYSIPIALRNKFLTDAYMPVVTALRDQFYSSGTLKTVRINQPGSNYTYANITIQGDGYATGEKITLTGYTVVSNGSGYYAATVSIDPPVAGVSTWLASQQVLVGQKLTYQNNVYDVSVSGITHASVGPVHRIGKVTNGTAVLEFVGRTATAEAVISTSTVSAGSFIVGKIYKIASLGTTTNTQWNTIAGTAGVTYTVGSNFTAAIVGTGLGTGTGTYKTIDLILYAMMKSIDVINGGSGYTSAPTVNFSGGNGTGATAIALLQNGSVKQVIITDPGSDYTSNPTVTLGTQWVGLTSSAIGDQIYYSNRLYTVAGAGYTGSVAPIHVSGTVTNSPAFAFSTALTLNSTVYVSTRLYKVTTAGTTSVGTTPTHTTGTVTNGTAALLYLGVPATLTYAGITATVSGSIKYGSGYSSYPTITVTSATGAGAGFSFTGAKTEARILPIIAADTLGQQWVLSTAYTAGLKVWYSTRLYTVTTAGTSSTVAPSHTSGSQTNGTAIFKFEGYFGQLVGVQVDDPGTGYTFANLNVTGDGSGAEIDVDLSPGDINSLQSNIELLTVDGRIMNCPVISQGYGYGAATVTITGDGSGATAVAVISNGAISKISMTNYGSGYRYANVLITGPGKGAKARAIIGPYGGYGKDALNNLFARSLMFYSNVSKDKNQGFDVNNDYRQLGIIKSPRKYNNNQPLASILASGCWVISGAANTTLFPADSIITKTGTSYRFRIVTNTGSALLVQSLDNAIISIGDSFTSANSNLFVCSGVTPPTVDKYSGDLLFIDNKQAFTPTADETVTLRTVLKF